MDTDTPGDDVVDDVEDFLEPDDDSAAGEDMASDNDPGLPPEGDDPMEGTAPSG